MKLAFRGGDINGTTRVPASKSHTHRAFFLAGMANGESVITNPLLSDDTLATVAVMCGLGANIIEENTELWRVRGGNLHPPDLILDAKNSGTTARILAGIVSMFDTPIKITGDSSLKKRPMGPLLDALSQLGVECTSDDGKPPVEIKGSNKGGKVTIDGSVSSQFITSLLMVSPMLQNDSDIVVTGTQVSRPYLDVTVKMMRLFGADVSSGNNTFHVKGNTGYTPHDYDVPADFSSAAFPLVAGALGGKVTIEGLQMDDPQGDKVILDILKDVGATVKIDGNSVTVEKNRIKAIDIDIGACPDLFPILAVLLSTAEGTSRLYGAPQLKYKESDRIRTTVDMLKAIGADAEATDDGCVIKGKKELNGGAVSTEKDHRIMMAAAIASIVCKNEVIMDDAECYMVSYPMFPYRMRSLGMEVEELDVQDREFSGL